MIYEEKQDVIPENQRNPAWMGRVFVLVGRVRLCVGGWSKAFGGACCVAGLRVGVDVCCRACCVVGFVRV